MILKLQHSFTRLLSAALPLAVSLSTVACGSSAVTHEAASTDANEASEAREAAPKSVSRGNVPSRCAKGKAYRDECVPPPGWVERLCDDVYPDVALHMFRPGTPWKRLYMVARAEPFNASGGASLLGDKLERGEEVIALRRRGNDATSVQVGDVSGYDILRWNGACATVHDGDFAEARPRDIVHSKVEWRRLSLPLRQALEAQPSISAAYTARRKSCRGLSIGIVSDTCEQQDKALMTEVVRYVESGARLPPAAKSP